MELLKERVTSYSLLKSLLNALERSKLLFDKNCSEDVNGIPNKG
jgi:hypothetical protein